MGITDGSVVCAHCGEWRTTCSLCIGEEKTTDRKAMFARRDIEEREADREIARQSNAIKRAANPHL